MSQPLTTATTTPFNADQAIARHHADITACLQAAHECRKWAAKYREAAYFYDEAARHAAGELSRVIQVKWAMEVQA